MSIFHSINDDKNREVTRGVIVRENGKFDQTPFRPIQNKKSMGTSSSIAKNINADRRRNNSNTNFRRSLIRSHRSPRCFGGDNKSVPRNGIKPMAALTSDRTLPHSPPIATPKRQKRYSMMMTMMDHYSYSPSPTSVASTITPSTTESTSSNSSFSTFFSHSDNDDIGFHGIHEEELQWRGDSDDEESQTTMSTRAPLISKLLRNELERIDSSHDELDKDEYKMSSHMCKFALSSSVGVCIWILFFALSMSINSDTSHWDQIRYASSIFWTVGGDDYPGNDSPRINNYQRIITCVFMTGSLGFMGVALGQWGDAIIRTYEAVLFKKGGEVQKRNCAQTYYTFERGRRSYHRRRQKAASYEQEQKKHRRWHKTVTDDNDHNYGSLPLSASKHNRRQWHDLSPLKFPDSSDDETDYGNRSEDDDDSFILFPRINWLLLQSLFLTTLSVICVASIRYCEQKQHSLLTTGGTGTNESIIGRESGFDGGENEWDVVSTLYYAVSTATTAGVKNAFEPVSLDGKFLALFFVPLSVITSLHWIVYIAQNRIQKLQIIRYQLKKGISEGGERKVLVDEGDRFDANVSREIVLVANAKHKLNGQNSASNDNDSDNDNDDYVVRRPVSSISRTTGSEFSLEMFYELELQQMGLVDIETFRVLKRKYELQLRVKLKETDGL